jgi:hypothetical protein
VALQARGQCYKTNTMVIYPRFRLNYYYSPYNIEFTLEWQYIFHGILNLEKVGLKLLQKITAVFIALALGACIIKLIMAGKS